MREIEDVPGEELGRHLRQGQRRIARHLAQCAPAGADDGAAVGHRLKSRPAERLLPQGRHHGDGGAGEMPERLLMGQESRKLHLAS